MLYLIKQIWHEQPLRFSLSIIALAVAGLLEGVGVASLVPMLQVVGQGQTSAAPGMVMAGDAIARSLRLLHLPFNLTTVLGFTLFFILASQMATLLQQRLLASSAGLFEEVLRKRLYRAVLAAEWPYFLEVKSSDVTSSLLSDPWRAWSAYMVLVQMIGTCITVLVYLALALVLSWRMTLAVLVTGGIVVGLLRGRTSLGTRYGKQQSDVEAEIHGHISESLLAAKLIKASSAELPATRRYDTLVETRQGILFRNNLNAAWIRTIYDSGSVATAFLGMYVAVTYFGMTVLALTVFLFVFYRLSPRVSNIQANYSLGLSYVPGVVRVYEYIDHAARMKEESGTRPLEPLRDAIELRDVSFAYGTTQVLRHLNLTIPCGASTAIIGPSGSGKTTIMDLVLGLLVPQSGEVTADGVPLREVRLSDWRRQIGYVAQDSSFFHASVADNIGFGLEGVSESAIIEAARMAHADEFIRELPEGYKTIIGDRGVRLSGGQRQRLALARAIVRKPSLLVLDEATSALDAKSEERIQKAVDELAQNVTILTVTHRLATVKNANIVHVIDEGRVVESGSWSELLAAGGRLSELAAIQGLQQEPGPEGETGPSIQGPT